MDKYVNILTEGKRIIQFAKDNYDKLKERADNAEIVTYGTKVLGLGRFCPSLIHHKINRKHSRGKLLKKIPNELQDYTIYESDINKSPLRLKCYNKYGCSSSLYIFKENSITYAVPFRGETDNFDYTDSYLMVYDNDKILSYARFREISLVLEEYDYSQMDKGIISCELIWYSNPSMKEMTPTSAEFYKRIVEGLEKRGRKLPSEYGIPKMSKWIYKLYYKDNKLLYIEEFDNNQEDLILNRVIK
jgi:hypothetical protein